MEVTFRRDGTAFLDRDAVTRFLGHSARTVRNHCTPAHYSRDGRAWYELEATVAALRPVKTRTTRPVSLNLRDSYAMLAGEPVCPERLSEAS